MYILDCCDKLFEQYLSYMENSTKKKASVWPFQMMLLVLCPVSILDIDPDKMLFFFSQKIC